MTLPSGRTARLSPADIFDADTRGQTALFHVHLLSTPATTSGRIETIGYLPGIVGSSASWRRGCQQITRHARAGRWVTVSGEPGSGRTAVLKAAATAHVLTPTRIFSSAELVADDSAVQALEQELAQDRFNVILRDIDLLDNEYQRLLAELIQGREDAGWLGATIGGATHDTEADSLLLTRFSHTVPVPALRHQIEDLHDLVPHLLRQLGRGTEPKLSSAAMRMSQLSKYSWPGNVSELREVLRDVVQRQRSGVIEIEQLPPMCRALSRHVLTPIEALERDAIVRSLEENAGNKKAAATALGISRATIYRRIKEFGIIG